MYKKILVACILFIVNSCAFSSTISSASLASDYSSWNNIPYLGVEYGFGGNIFAGVGKTFGLSQKYYLAGEASLLLPGFGVGASIIPGILLTPHTLLYTRLGVEKGGEQNWVAGFGLQTNLAKNWDLRCELNTDNLFKLGLVYKFW